jgi:hypothetical protein
MECFRIQLFTEPIPPKPVRPIRRGPGVDPNFQHHMSMVIQQYQVDVSLYNEKVIIVSNRQLTS